MNPKTLTLTLATMAVVGCTPTRLAVRQGDHTVLPPLGPSSQVKGQIIAPKRCDLRLVVLSRPLNDEAINKALWSVADEQVLAPEAHQMLESNGLRIGLISGNLPTEVDTILHAPPPNKIEPSQVNIPSGDNSLFCVSPATSKVSLIINRRDLASGKDFTDAKGLLRVTATHEGSNGVTLRFVPEIHHGPIQHRFAPDASSSLFAVQQFVMKDGQQEDTLRELAASVSIQPGQLVVIGCDPDRSRSLGQFLLTEMEGNSDRILQKVLLVWAEQSYAEGTKPVTTVPDTPVRKGATDIARSKEEPPAATPNQKKDRPL
jgi:hypothetical protein